MSHKDSTIDDVLEAIGEFSNKVENRFDTVEARLGNVEGKFDKVESRLVKIEANMVTKDILDEKLADLKADLAILMRKEDHKLVALVEVLKNKRVISEEDVKQILAMEPFPKSV